MMNRKAVELSLDAMVIAVIVLIVLVVSIAIYTGGTKRFTATVNSCEQNGGECISQNDCENTRLSYDCQKDNICCLREFGLT